ncbi:hypothetical protein LCGC14_0454070 [marine sediment metagenome]|uniref:Uncharacterized protein n=1 Tax=marine sediment metagenome TaxID=412755 RepID=A0A0F9T035_9ZZZZ
MVNIRKDQWSRIKDTIDTLEIKLKENLMPTVKESLGIDFYFDKLHSEIIGIDSRIEGRKEAKKIVERLTA